MADMDNCHVTGTQDRRRARAYADVVGPLVTVWHADWEFFTAGGRSPRFFFRLGKYLPRPCDEGEYMPETVLEFRSYIN